MARAHRRRGCALSRATRPVGVLLAGGLPRAERLLTEQPTIAALFVQARGCYSDLPGVDPWTEARDARLYAGPYSVVGHPPCARWCALAGLVKARWGYEIGDDGGCFEAALAAVRTWGGVLEHPAYSLAWGRYGLAYPAKGGGWQQCLDGSWVCEVAQVAYGHRARKLTWLFYIGDHPPADLDWSRPVASAWVGYTNNHPSKRRGMVERLSKKQRNATPTAFRDALIELARNARR